MTESGEPLDTTDLTATTPVAEDGPQLIVKPSVVTEADEAAREVVFSTTDEATPHRQGNHWVLP